jgi:ABC-type Fe3+-siderophore transport system permease subunit
VVLADALVSNLSGTFGTELPVGVVTSLVGGPLFLLLLIRRAREVSP